MLNVAFLAEWDLRSPLWHSREKKPHVLKLEEKRKLAQAGRETQQELVFYLLKFNRDISALD